MKVKCDDCQSIFEFEFENPDIAQDASGENTRCPLCQSTLFVKLDGTTVAPLKKLLEKDDSPGVVITSNN